MALPGDEQLTKGDKHQKPPEKKDGPEIEAAKKETCPKDHKALFLSDREVEIVFTACELYMNSPKDRSRSMYKNLNFLNELSRKLDRLGIEKKKEDAIDLLYSDQDSYSLAIKDCRDKGDVCLLRPPKPRSKKYRLGDEPKQYFIHERLVKFVRDCFEGGEGWAVDDATLTLLIECVGDKFGAKRTEAKDDR